MNNSHSIRSTNPMHMVNHNRPPAIFGFPGDTRPTTLPGNQSLMLREMASRFDRTGEQFRSYSLAPDRRQVESALQSARLVGETLRLIEITLDTGEKLRAAPDQKFNLWDGADASSALRACRLSAGSLLAGLDMAPSLTTKDPDTGLRPTHLPMSLALPSDSSPFSPAVQDGTHPPSGYGAFYSDRMSAADAELIFLLARCARSVISVEEIKLDRPIELYSAAVPHCGNFALAAGIFVVAGGL